MKTKFLLLAFSFLFVLFIISCYHDPIKDNSSELEKLIKSHSPTGSIDYYIMPESTDYSNLPNQDPKNPITAEKVALGNLLFFETAIGTKSKKTESIGTYSCSSCHIVEKNFTAGRIQGIADGGLGFGHLGSGRFKNPHYEGGEVDAQGARPLPTINLTYVRNALWSGAFGSRGMNVGTERAWGVTDSLTNINFEIFEGLEANNHRALITHRQDINKEAMDKLGYTKMFDAAFPNEPVQTRYSLQIGANAIAAYFRTILTNQAPFQRWLKGDENAMTDKQKKGAELFFGKAKCVNCHNSPSFNNQLFAAVGVKDHFQNGQEVFRTGPSDARNKGRGGFTLVDADLYKFKVPQLYNLKGIGFYFHGGSKNSIKEVVQYFNNAVPENPNVPLNRIDPQFVFLGLTSEEIDDLTEFIENGLYDPNLVRYKPKEVLSGNCIPNNDALAKGDMGCN